MYRIPSDLNLDTIIGCDLNQMGLGRHDIQFHFDGSGLHITAQGKITLTENGGIIAQWDEKNNWTSLSFQKILNATVKTYSVVHDRLLEIEFENGLALQLHDDTDQYEAMQIYFDDKTKPTIII